MYSVFSDILDALINMDLLFTISLTADRPLVLVAVRLADVSFDVRRFPDSGRPDHNDLDRDFRWRIRRTVRV